MTERFPSDHSLASWISDCFFFFLRKTVEISIDAENVVTEAEARLGGRLENVLDSPF